MADHSDHGDWNATVTVSLFTDNDNYLGTQDVPLNSLGNLIPVNLTSLTAQKTPYNLTCKGEVNGQTFYTGSQVRYLPPNPYGGNTVKVNRTSGALLVRNETAGEKQWNQLFAYGFYDVSALYQRLTRLIAVHSRTTRPLPYLMAMGRASTP